MTSPPETPEIGRTVDGADGLSEAEVMAIVDSCSNAGRWGPDDELGTLNYITADHRRRASTLVVEGECVSLGKDLDFEQNAVNPRPAWHVMHLEVERPYATADSLHLQVHGLATTHLDALGHMFFEGRGYNGSWQHDVVTNAGLLRTSIHAMRAGIFSRGVLLDVAAAVGREWLEPGDEVTPQLLRRAEEQAGVDVGTGDVVVVHTGLERREALLGPEDPSLRAGLSVSCLPWLHERRVAVYTGDCIERLPQPYPRFELPLHQIGIASMGLVLLDCPRLSDLLEACGRLRRADFLFTVAPLRVRGGTGSPVNPLALF